MEIIRDGTRAVTVKSPSFHQVVVEAEPGILLFRFEGDIPEEAFAPAGELMDACLARHGTICFIGNGMNWGSYGAGYRERWTDWFSKHRASVKSVHLLVRSPILRLGVQVVNMVTRGVITPFSDAQSFEASVRKAFPRLDLAQLRLHDVQRP